MANRALSAKEIIKYIRNAKVSFSYSDSSVAGASEFYRQIHNRSNFGNIVSRTALGLSNSSSCNKYGPHLVIWFGSKGPQ